MGEFINYKLNLSFIIMCDSTGIKLHPNVRNSRPGDQSRRRTCGRKYFVLDGNDETQRKPTPVLNFRILDYTKSSKLNKS